MRSWVCGVVVVCLAAVRGGVACAHQGTDVMAEAARDQVAARPLDPEAHVQQATVYEVAGQWDAALAAFARAEECGADRDAVALARGRVLRAAGRVRLAKREIGRVLAHRPAAGGALVERARLWRMLGQPDKAARDLGLAIAVLPQPTPDHVFERRDALLAAGKQAEAIRALDEGIARLGAVPALELAALDLETGTGGTSAALARIDRLLARHPGNPMWETRRGELLAAAGRPDDARATYARALALIEARPARRRGPEIAQLEHRLRAALAPAESSTEGTP